MAQLIGFQKMLLSPPMYILGSYSASRLKKSTLMPMASGNRPRTVVMAVRSTGRRRVRPPCTIMGTISVKGSMSSSPRSSSALRRSMSRLV